MAEPALQQQYRRALQHLARDPALAAVIKRIGPCTLVPQPTQPFVMLVRCVVWQQISLKAAESIFERLGRTIGRFTPQRLAAATDETLRAAGISGPKIRTLRALTSHIQADPFFLRTLAKLNDDDFREAITRIKGIGPWTADMMLMFGYGRLDVLPVGDYGIRVAAHRLYGLKELPKPPTLFALAEPWRPYRTVASWYLWKSLDQR